MTKENMPNNNRIKRALAANPDLLTRTFSALILIPIALLLLWLGGHYFLALALATCMLMFWEWVKIVGSRRRGASGLAGFLLLAGIGGLLLSGLYIYALLAVVIGVISVYAAGGFSKSARWVGEGFLYASLSLIAIYSLRLGENGFWAVFFLLVVVWVTDVGAYICGRSIGGAKLWPAVSPGKTWSGAIGGLLLAVLAGVLMARFAGSQNYAYVIGITFILSVSSQLGDLFESALKRRFGVKDSSALIPGHGGVLDRMDGLVFACVVAYIIALMIGGALEMPATALLSLS
ncbi:phosphatidate cytidylyltransferase [Polycladidibacter stylochi]|uniref:phosphatidate cytidylyltransferase n=1 Tax=Polycladidibacter stylochi TaxID=1807766 RepID=UPI000835F264|nr:phosphatidate cytidylyltransferase [Pseudovibrio stylochi]